MVLSTCCGEHLVTAWRVLWGAGAWHRFGSQRLERGQIDAYRARPEFAHFHGAGPAQDFAYWQALRIDA